MKNKSLLDSPISEFLSDGYPVCKSCRRYENHKISFCQECGMPLMAEKKMTWRQFIKEQANVGSGPLNTFWSYLSMLAKVEAFGELPSPFKEQYEEAQKVSEDAEETMGVRPRVLFYDRTGPDAFRYKRKLGEWTVGRNELNDYVEHVYGRSVSTIQFTALEVKMLEKERVRYHTNLIKSAGFTRDDMSEAHSRFEAYLDDFLAKNIEEEKKLSVRSPNEITEEILEYIYGHPLPYDVVVRCSWLQRKQSA